MSYDRDYSQLIEHLPLYLREFKELRNLIEAEQAEFDKLQDELAGTMKDQFILSAGENGISRFETMLGLIPKNNETLDDRRFRVFGALNEKLPYTEAKLGSLLTALCGEDGFDIDIDYEKCEISVKVKLAAKNMADEARKLLERILPVNMLIELALMYNTWRMAAERMTWNDVAKLTWNELKEGEL